MRKISILISRQDPPLWFNTSHILTPDEDCLKDCKFNVGYSDEKGKTNRLKSI
jgi:hypothetical protein